MADRRMKLVPAGPLYDDAGAFIGEVLKPIREGDMFVAKNFRFADGTSPEAGQEVPLAILAAMNRASNV